MKRGRHAASDGSFGRSAGVAAGRGAALIAVAVVVGFFLLQRTDDVPDEIVVTSEETTTTARRAVPTVAPTTTAPLRAPKDVKVLVINGTTVSGAGTRVTTALRRTGYNTLSPADATAGIKAEKRPSAVYFVSREFEREAAELQRSLQLPVKPVELLPTDPPLTTSDQTRNANVVVLVGEELTTAQSGGGTTTTTARRTATTRRPAATTTTTARPATSTTPTTAAD